MIVVVIIMVLLMLGPLSQDEEKKIPVYQTRMQQAGDVTCRTNINTMNTQLIQIRLASPGAPLTPKILEKKGILRKCPDGGKYVVGPDGQLYCDKHFPPPGATPPAGEPVAASGVSQP